MPDLGRLGWNPYWELRFEPFAEQGLLAARVVRQDRGAYLVCGQQGEYMAEVSGRFRHDASSRSEFPAIGDWVGVRVLAEAGPKAVIHALLPRKSRFSRKIAGAHTEEQVAAANVDTVFLVSGLDNDFNPRRIERYLAVACNSGAEPVILLNKMDLCDDIDAKAAATRLLAPGVPVCPVSAATRTGMDLLLPYVGAGRTSVFLGSSGVGKSSLVNCLLQSAYLEVQPVRQQDSHGRHTTTHRELICLPQGGALIDTPGMRELQLWTDADGLDLPFLDIDQLAQCCRFRDCGHENEPGCAVQAAILDGRLPPERLASYRKLAKELERLDRKQQERVRIVGRMTRKASVRRKHHWPEDDVA